MRQNPVRPIDWGRQHPDVGLRACRVGGVLAGWRSSSPEPAWGPGGRPAPAFPAGQQVGRGRSRKGRDLTVQSGSSVS